MLHHRGKKTNSARPRKPVLLSSASGLNRAVVPVASNNLRPQGFVGNASAAQGEAVTVYGEGSIVEAVAAASIGAGGEVGVGSTNGDLGIVAGASGVTRWACGQALEDVAAGEVFSVYVKTRQVSNLI